jgi:hypothetical protein
MLLNNRLSEKYIVLMMNLMIISRLTSLHSAKAISAYAPFSMPLKKGKARDIGKNAEVIEDDNNTNNVSDDWHEELQFAIGQPRCVSLTKFKSTECCIPSAKPLLVLQRGLKARDQKLIKLTIH